MPAVFIYDGECGFCAASAGFLRERVNPEDVQVRPWQEIDLAALGVTEQQCREAAAFVTAGADGSPEPARFGAAAIAGMLGHMRRPWPLAGAAIQAPGVRALAPVVYAWVARNRHRLRWPRSQNR